MVERNYAVAKTRMKSISPLIDFLATIIKHATAGSDNVAKSHFCCFLQFDDRFSDRVCAEVVIRTPRESLSHQPWPMLPLPVGAKHQPMYIETSAFRFQAAQHF